MKIIEASYSLRRVQRAVGSEVWPKRKVRSVAELRELREAIDDAPVRKQQDERRSDLRACIIGLLR